MSRLILEMPASSLSALGGSDESAGDELRIAAAMKLYEIGRLSAGAAAELAGFSKPVFLSRLAQYDLMTFRQSDAELSREVENA